MVRPRNFRSMHFWIWKGFLSWRMQSPSVNLAWKQHKLKVFSKNWYRLFAYCSGKKWTQKLKLVSFCPIKFIIIRNYPWLRASELHNCEFMQPRLISIVSKPIKVVVVVFVKKNKPSFCSGSCDEIHATTFCEIFLKHKLFVNTLKTSLKHPWNFLETPLKLSLDVFETALKLP